MIADPHKAKQLGFTYYHTGRRCKHGHHSPRYASNKVCVTCTNLFRAKRRLNAADYQKEYFREYDQKRSLDRKSYFREYYQRNRKKIDRQVNVRPHHKAAKRSANYRRRDLFQTANLYKDHSDIQIKMRKIYEQMMSMRADGHNVNVDHIIPIKSPTVCGLHVPWNLRVIDQTANIKKSNRYSHDHNFLGLKKRPRSGA